MRKLSLRAQTVFVILTIVVLFFFYMLFVNATRTHIDLQKGFAFLPGRAFLENVEKVANDATIPIFSGIVNSLLVAAGCALLSTYFSAMTAYGLYIYDFRLNRPAFTFILMVMVMPAQVSALGFVRMMNGVGLNDSLWPLILPAIASPSVFYFMYCSMQTNLPTSLVEAARIDGAGEFYIFNVICLPLLKPALAVQAIFTFVSSWNNYFVPELLITTKSKQTLPILIANLRAADFMSLDMGKVYMMIAIAIVPIIIVYVFLSRYIIKGVMFGAETLGQSEY